MSQERTEAVVLRGVDFSETSRVITFLTPDRGRLACMAKGIRRARSPLSAALDTMNRLEIIYYWKDGRELQALGEVTLLDSFHAIKTDLEKAAFCAFPLEVAGKVAHENEPSQPLYAALVTGLEGLAAWGGDVRAHVCWQVVRLLAAAGFEPSVEACVHCGRATPRPAGFSLKGGVTCSHCASDRPLPPEQAVALRALLASGESCPPVESAGAVYALLSAYAAYQLETGFRSVRVIEEMFGKTASNHGGRHREH